MGGDTTEAALGEDSGTYSFRENKGLSNFMATHVVPFDRLRV